MTHSIPDRRKILILFLFFSGFLLDFYYFHLNLNERNNTGVAYMSLASGIILLASIIYYLKTNRRENTFLAGLFVCSTQIISLLFIGTNNDKGLYWLLVLPPIVFYTQGKQKGLYFTGSVILIMLGTFIFFRNHMLNTGVTLDQYLDLLFMFSIISSMTYVYEKAAEIKTGRLKEHIYRDYLTMLPNRNSLIKDLGEQRVRWLILINIDRFKEINSVYGTDIGDGLLRKTGSTLTEEALEHTRVYKLNSDEYALLVEEEAQSLNAESYVKKIIEAFSGGLFVEGIHIPVSITMGISFGDSRLLARCNAALQEARARRASYYFYEKSIEKKEFYRENIRLYFTLNKALTRDLIIPYYQPIVYNRDGSVCKYECLMRVRVGEDILRPHEFIDAAKKTRLYPHFSRSLISKACADFADIQDHVSINTCIEDIDNPETVDHICRELTRYKMGPRVIFEILETERVEDHPALPGFITRVRELGARIAIDDFGSGYSNMDFLLKMKFDYLKIDGVLIKSICTDPNSLALVKMIVSICKEMGTATIAEYVYSQEVFERVRSLGVDFSQGYYIGEPAPLGQQVEAGTVLPGRIHADIIS